MDAEQLWTKYPRAYHMAHVGSWPSIARHGLLSTSSLLDLFEVPPADRIPLETRRRPESVTIIHPQHGTAVIRDQKPLSEVRLQKCLDGMTIAEWFQLLNGRVFFWLDEQRLNGLRGAQAYRQHRQTVITVDTRRLVERHQPRIRLAHMNTGATRPFAHPRGANTFLTLADYPFRQRRRVVELTVDRGVQDISEVVVGVEEVGGVDARAIIWPVD